MVLDILTIQFLVSGWVLILIMVFERRRDVLRAPSIKRMKKTQTNASASHQKLVVGRSEPNASDEYAHLLQGIQSEIERQKLTVGDKDAGL